MSSSSSPLAGLLDVVAAAAASLRTTEPVVSFEQEGTGPPDPLSTITGEYAFREGGIGAGGVSVVQRVDDGMSRRSKKRLPT